MPHSQTEDGLPKEQAVPAHHVTVFPAARSRLPWLRLPMLRRSPSEPHRTCLQHECGNNHRTHKIADTVAADTNLSMSAPTPESPTPTAVGPPPPSRALPRHAVSMSPDVLPVDMWHIIIIMYLDHRCFACFVLRQTCPFLAHVTEQVFAPYVSRTCSPRFAGQTLSTFAVSRVSPATALGKLSLTMPALLISVVILNLQPPQYHAANVLLPSFRFQPSSFAPATTNARLVLKLSSPATARDTPSLHHAHAETADLTSRLTQVFFQPGPVADAERTRLLNQAHFVLFNDQLKSIRLPSAAGHVTAQELSLDWRQLCHTFMHDEFKCRFASTASVAWWRDFS